MMAHKSILFTLFTPPRSGTEQENICSSFYCCICLCTLVWEKILSCSSAKCLHKKDLKDYIQPSIVILFLEPSVCKDSSLPDTNSLESL